MTMKPCTALITPALLLMTFLSCMFMSGCSPRPQYPVIPRDKALSLDAVMEMKVTKVFDGLIHSRDPHVTHLVEVEILRGPTDIVGEHITLPYDRYNTGKKPPHAGSTVTLAPSSWLKRDRKNFGRGR